MRLGVVASPVRNSPLANIASSCVATCLAFMIVKYKCRSNLARQPLMRGSRWSTFQYHVAKLTRIAALGYSSRVSHFRYLNKGEETIAERNNREFRLRTRSDGNCCHVRMWIALLFIGRSRPHLSGVSCPFWLSLLRGSLPRRAPGGPAALRCSLRQPPWLHLRFKHNAPIHLFTRLACVSSTRKRRN